jgi:hypothetical protein
LGYYSWQVESLLESLSLNNNNLLIKRLVLVLVPVIVLPLVPMEHTLLINAQLEEHSLPVPNGRMKHAPAIKVHQVEEPRVEQPLVKLQEHLAQPHVQTEKHLATLVQVEDHSHLALNGQLKHAEQLAALQLAVQQQLENVIQE